MHDLLNFRSNKDELTLDRLRGAAAVVFGCPSEKFSAGEVSPLEFMETPVQFRAVRLNQNLP